MSDSHPQNVSWAMQQQLDTLEIIHKARLEACKKGEILRLKGGLRMVWKGGPENIPTPEEREAAKRALEPVHKNHKFLAHCPCCETTYGMASVYEFVAEHGVCGYCLAYVEGRADGVLMKRDPTVEEALAVDPGYLEAAEARVLHAEVLRLRGEEAK